MKKLLLLTIFSAGLFSSCSNKSDAPKQASDTLLAKPMLIDSGAVIQEPKDVNTGLIIDRARLRTPEHEKMLSRFTPDEVVIIFHDFRPLRKEGIKQEEIAAFLKKKKITLDELKAVLEEGDRLGWSKKQ